MDTMQATNTTTIPMRKEAGPPVATGVARRGGQAFEQLLALTAGGFLQSFAQEIRSLVPGDTSAPAGRDNAHARRLSVMQAEDAQSAMGMRASELSGLSPRGQRLGAQRAELARSAASGTSPGDFNAGGDGTRETRSETSQLIETKIATATKTAPSGTTRGSSTSAGTLTGESSASRAFATELNGAAESRTARSQSAVPLSATASAQASSAVTRSGRSGDLAKQVAEALLGRAGATSGRAAGSARLGSTFAPPAETPRGTTAGRAGQGSPRPGAPDRATRDEAGTEATSKPAFRKLLKSIHLSTGTRKSTARMHLNPPELGRMRVDVRLEGQRLFVKIRTQRHEARELIAKNVQSLRQSLERHGVRVEQFELRSGMADDRLPAEAPSYAFESDRQTGQRRTRHDPDSGERHRSALEKPTEEDESSDVRGAASPRPVAKDRRLDVRV